MTQFRAFVFVLASLISYSTLSFAGTPSVPTLTGRTTATSTTVTVNWTASTNSPTTYFLDVATDSAFASMVLSNQNTGNVTSYQVTGVTAGTIYWYRVKACNGAGNTTCSALSTGMSVDFTDYTAPSLLSLTVATSSSDTNPVVISTGTSLNGGPYVRSATPYLSANFSEPVSGIQYGTSIVLKNYGNSSVQTISSYTPANNTTATPAGNPSSATFTAPTLATTSCTTSKYSVTLTGGQTATTIHDAWTATLSNSNALISPPTYYFTVDTQAPTIASVTPVNNATGVSVTQSITVVFTENCSMDNTAYTPANIVLTDSDGNVVPTTISSSASPFTTITVTPASNLNNNTTYTLTLSNIADAAGNLLGGTGSYTSVFSTQSISASNFSIIPSFLSSPVTPNVLIVLDNSNSMDETLVTGDAIGSFNCTNSNDLNTCSRSVLARKALINLINTYAGKINIGLMSYYLPDNTSRSWYVYNNFYFVTYDPATYCGIIPPPAACYNYCVQENPRSYPGTNYGVGVAGVNYTPSTNEADCNSACRTGQTISAPVINYTGIFNSAFQANIREPIITGTTDSNGSALNGSKRQTYCNNIYPKTVAYNYADGATPANTGTLYHSIVGTFYDTGTGWGTSFIHAPSYSTDDNHSNSSSYTFYRQKATPTSYPYDVGYNASWNSTAFAGTDDDLANGFQNYGQSNMYYPPYNGNPAPTWSSNPYTVSGGNTGGFLHVPAALNDPANNTQLNALLNKIGQGSAPPSTYGFKNDATGYMACSSSGAAANRCSYIVNAGATPTAATLQDAINYLNGALPAGKTQANVRPSTPIQNSCQKTFIIFVTDGLPSVDDGSGTVTDATALVTGKNAAGAAVTVPGGTVLSKLNSLRCPSSPTAANCGVSNSINGATVNTDVMTYILGLSISPKSQTLLDQMAVAGGKDANGHAYYANDPTGLNNALVSIFQNILSQISAGTAASILNNSEGSGANMLQAVFYPSKTFDSSTACGWVGEMQNLWYFLDPKLQNSSIREDSNQDNKLNLKDDKIATFYYDNTQNKTLVNLYTDANGDGIADSSTPDATVSPDYVKSLWKAGILLWSRNLGTDPRTIYTGYNSTGGATPNLLGTSLFNTNATIDLLQVPAALTLPQRQAKAATLLNWVSGADQANDSDGTVYRSRMVTMGTCSNDASQRCTVATAGSDCLINGTSGSCSVQTNTWKLGDVISSTPKLVSSIKLNSYDLASPGGYSDSSYAGFASTSTYLNRGMVFVGSNDGMLHAFKLGVLKELTGKYDKSQILGNNLGHEEWAYVPKSVLPYLTYLTSATYPHMYLVDKTPAIADVSIGVPSGCVGDYSTCIKDASTWRTVLIGGMGIGGAVKATTDSCSAPAACVKPPIPDTGLSSYFALDVTDPETPKYLWEFNGDPTTGNYLGYATSGPALVRIAPKTAQGVPDNTKNGKWFAVFASGPTGPIDTTLNKFSGQSDQNLRLFIVDLATGTLVKTIDTGITNAFGGTLTTSWIDVDRRDPTSKGYYSDDAIYIGYTQLDSAAGTWTKGGVIRLLTQESTDPASSDSTKQWKWSTLISGTGPVTTSITKLQDRSNNNLWIYFGTGRYFYKGDDPSMTSTQRLYAVKEPCYSQLTNKFDLTCTTSVTNSTTTTCSTVLGTASGLCDQSGTTSNAPSPTLDKGMAGWFVTLDAASGTTYSERVITDPVALANGNVFFTTFKQNSDVCSFGGNSFIWALNYATGAAPAASTMQGTAMMQTSSGAFTEVKLTDGFKNAGNQRLDGRRTVNAIQGVPPTSQGLSVVTNPKPVKKFLHVREL